MATHIEPDAAERFGACPVCHQPLSAEKTRRLIKNDDLEGWFCSTRCERRWWGAADLIASLQSEDAKLHAVRARRMGSPLLWEERHSSPVFEEEPRAWADSPFGTATVTASRFRDAVLARMGGGVLHRLLRDLHNIALRPHRMLGGKPKQLPDLSDVDGESS